jgi:hypothetical protein
MDVWQAGKKVGWICSRIMRSLAFDLGMIFSLDCAWSCNRRELVIVVFCSLASGVASGVCLPRPVALSVHLFEYLYDTLQ